MIIIIVMLYVLYIQKVWWLKIPEKKYEKAEVFELALFVQCAHCAVNTASLLLPMFSHIAFKISFRNTFTFDTVLYCIFLTKISPELIYMITRSIHPKSEHELVGGRVKMDFRQKTGRSGPFMHQSGWFQGVKSPKCWCRRSRRFGFSRWWPETGRFARFSGPRGPKWSVHL